MKVQPKEPQLADLVAHPLHHCSTRIRQCLFAESIYPPSSPLLLQTWMFAVYAVGSHWMSVSSIRTLLARRVWSLFSWSRWSLRPIASCFTAWWIGRLLAKMQPATNLYCCWIEQRMDFPRRHCYPGQQLARRDQTSASLAALVL